MAGHMEESTAAIIWKLKVSASLPQLREQLVVTGPVVPRMQPQNYLHTYSCVLLYSNIPACRTERTKAIRVRFACLGRSTDLQAKPLQAQRHELVI